ncbi:hypothetical protein [Mesorhizobium sp. L103C119B0]|uniref:hypothetical protein n=1 Tax=Mesorhizobium sp. L103C119B0 TaxID=1287085 RepID=UPI000406FEB2|nr:hypothetical protein [Mesorhizobium sp. L103C119B0]
MQELRARGAIVGPLTMSGATRQTTWRARQRRKEIVVPVAINLDVVAWLIETGRIDAVGSRDAVLVGEALRTLVIERVAAKK